MMMTCTTSQPFYSPSYPIAPTLHLSTCCENYPWHCHVMAVVWQEVCTW